MCVCVLCVIAGGWGEASSVSLSEYLLTRAPSLAFWASDQTQTRPRLSFGFKCTEKMGNKAGAGARAGARAGAPASVSGRWLRLWQLPQLFAQSRSTSHASQINYKLFRSSSAATVELLYFQPPFLMLRNLKN